MITKMISYIISVVMSFGGIIGDKIDNAVENVQYEKLQTAIICGNEQAMIEALNEGADINKFGNNYVGTISPIIWACHCQRSKRFIKTMLNYDMDPDLVDISGATVFCEAISEREEVYNKLLSLNPDVNFIDNKGNNVIYYEISSNYFKTKRLNDIIKMGAVVTEENIDSVIKIIDEYRGLDKSKIPYINGLKILIDNYHSGEIDKNLYAAYSGNFGKKNKCKSDIILYGIAGYCNKDTLERCLKKDSDLNLLLRIAIMANNMENTKYLLELGANVKDDGINENYGNALCFAVEYNNYDMTKYIASLNADSIDKCVNIAVNNNNIDMVKLLLDNGANVNNKEAFEEALKSNHDDIVKYFVRNGFDLNTSNSLNTETCYSIWVFSFCNLDTVKYIHQYCDKMNENDLHEAIYNSVETGNLELLEYLKELNADFSVEHVNSSDGSRFDSELVVATREGYFDVLKFLVENGSNTSNYSEEEKEFLVKEAKESNDIYNYLTSKNII